MKSKLFFAIGCAVMVFCLIPQTVLAQHKITGAMKSWDMTDLPSDAPLAYEFSSKNELLGGPECRITLTRDFTTLTLEIKQGTTSETLVLHKAGEKYEKGEISVDKTASNVSITSSHLLVQFADRLPELCSAVPTAACTYVDFLAKSAKAQVAKQ